LKQKVDSDGMISAKGILSLLTAAMALAAIKDPLGAQAGIKVVTSLADDGDGSLRGQIATAQSGDSISFAVRGAIVLTNGELLVTNNLRIAGPGATNLAVSGQIQSRILEIGPGAKVSLSGLTICDGHAPNGTAGTSNNPTGGNGVDGGGIYNAGSLTITRCIISNCAAGNGGSGFISPNSNDPDGTAATNWFGGPGGRGGAIYNAGKLWLNGSSLLSNSSGNGGNAGGARPYGTSGSAGGGGGGVYNAGTLTVQNSSFERNATGNGGNAYTFPYYYVPQPLGVGSGGAGGNGGALCDAGLTTTLVV
jgi:hypothetical protein